jgi:chromosomal replication initiation ATPase DnaA
LGSGEFVENTLKQANEQLEKHTRYQMKGITFESLTEKVAKYFGVVPKELFTNSKVAASPEPTFQEVRPASWEWQ